MASEHKTPSGLKSRCDGDSFGTTNVVSPLTGSNHVTLLETISARDLIEKWQKSFGINIESELQNCKKISLYQCNETQLKFFSPTTLAGSGDLYKQLQQFEWYYAPDKWEHQQALRDLAGYRNVLEIGCGSGHFVQAGLAAGLNIIGIELSDAAVEMAVASKLPVEKLPLEKAAGTYRGQMDAVCSFQVLEHVSNPREFIDWSVELLKPGGKLIMCVPNAEGFLKYYPDSLLDMPPHHVLRWNALSFHALEKLFPLKLENIVFEPLAEHHVPMYVTAYAHYYRSRSRLWKLCFNRVLMPCYRGILRTGINRCLTGMALYATFRKTQPRRSDKK